ncbi:hypothetical protein J4457_06495 [Candidatus Woesearchaeota archaeon]|nr:hypothetical protein [Candidatus Woesearchaeota archaeon]
MIQIPYEQIITKIGEVSQLSDAEIQVKIKAKLEQLSGLISKEGAAHIVANELGVKLFDKISGKVKLKEVQPGMRDLEIIGKVTQVYEIREFQSGERKGKVGSFRMADETKQMRITCWGSAADEITKLVPGDTIRITSAYSKENRGYVEIHLNDHSKLIRNPPGIVLENVALASPAQRKSIKELSDAEENVEVLGTIVQVFDPKFFEVCSICNKRARPQESNFICQEHGAVRPSYSYVFNAVLDDGTDTLRCVFFKNQAERLAGKSEQEMQSYRANPESFSVVKNDLLGQMVKLIGRVKMNEMFQRKEFTAQLVTINPNPEEELQRLNG